jgi:hypothetical protein
MRGARQGGREGSGRGNSGGMAVGASIGKNCSEGETEPATARVNLVDVLLVLFGPVIGIFFPHRIILGSSPEPTNFKLLSFFETGFPYASQADFELRNLLPLPPKCWDYRCEPKLKLV